MYQRRRARRSTYAASVRMRWGDSPGFYSGAIREVSRQGLYIHTFNLPPVGTPVELFFDNPLDGTPIELRASVIRVCTEDDSSQTEDVGFGARFVGSDNSDEGRLPVHVGEEQRRELRVPYETSLRFSVHGRSGARTGFIQDLSANGAFVHSWDLPEVGDEVGVSFRVPGAGRTADLDAEVRWVRPEAGARTANEIGFGLLFRSVPEAFVPFFESVVEENMDLLIRD